MRVRTLLVTIAKYADITPQIESSSLILLAPQSGGVRRRTDVAVPSVRGYPHSEHFGGLDVRLPGSNSLVEHLPLNP